jgi:hypothetical protein
MIRIHNITDRHGHGPARAITLAFQTVRPGKSIEVDKRHLNRRHEEMHGTSLWFGELPAALRRASKSGVKASKLARPAEPPMSLEEVRTYLRTLSEEKVRALCTCMSPPLEIPERASAEVVVVRLSRAVFQATRVLDPSSFFWLRRWTKKGGDYLEL